MPRVPTLDGPQVQTQQLPGVRVRDVNAMEALGGGESTQKLNQSIQNVGETVNKLVLQEKKKADDLAVTNAQAKAIQLKNDLFWNPEKGAMLRRGEDALGVQEEYLGQFDTESDAIFQSLSNETQKAAFQAKRQELRLDLDSTLQKHTFGEIQKFDDERTEANLKTFRDNAILNAHDPKAVAKSVDESKAVFMSYADRKGLPPEVVELKVKEIESKAHRGVIERLTTQPGGASEAMKRFELVKETLTGTDRAEVEKDLHASRIKGESMRLADEIVSNHGTKTSAYARAKEIQDPDVREAVEKRIDHEMSRRKEARTEYQTQLFQQAYNTWRENPDQLVTDAVPRNILKQLTPQQQAALEARAVQTRKGQEAPINSKEWREFYNMAADPEQRGKFSKVNLDEYAHKINPRQMTELVKIQAGLKSKDEKVLQQMDDYRSEVSVVNGVLKNANIDPDKSPRAIDFREQVAAEQRALQQQTGKKATNADLEAIAKRLIAKSRVQKNYWPDFSKHNFEMSPEERKRAYVDNVAQVPDTEKQRIKEALSRRGVPVTESAIMQLYTAKMRRSADAAE